MLIYIFMINYEPSLSIAVTVFRPGPNPFIIWSTSPVLQYYIDFSLTLNLKDVDDLHCAWRCQGTVLAASLVSSVVEIYGFFLSLVRDFLLCWLPEPPKIRLMYFLNPQEFFSHLFGSCSSAVLPCFLEVFFLTSNIVQPSGSTGSTGCSTFSSSLFLFHQIRGRIGFWVRDFCESFLLADVDSL